MLRPGLALVLVLSITYPFSTSAAPPACKIFNSRQLMRLADDCVWPGANTGAVVSVLGVQQASRPGPPAIAYDPAGASWHLPTGTSGAKLSYLILVGFQLPDPAGPDGFVPVGLAGNGQTSLVLQDVRITVDSMTLQQHVQYFQQLPGSRVYTDGASFLHVNHHVTNRMTWQSVGLLLATDLQDVRNTSVPPTTVDLTGKVSRKYSYVLAATNSTLVQQMQQVGAVSANVSAIIYLDTNVTLLKPPFPPDGIYIGRPLVLAGLASANTSTNFAMAINQIMLTGKYSYLTLDSVVIENLGPGDAKSAEIAKPLSISSANNFWALYFNRTENRSLFRNCTYVINAQVELDYYLYWSTVWRSTLPYFQQLAKFTREVIGITVWEVADPPAGDQSVFVIEMVAGACTAENTCYTVNPVVSPKMAVPPMDPSLRLQQNDKSPLVTAVSSVGALRDQLDPQDPLQADRMQVVLLRSNLTLSTKYAGTSKAFGPNMPPGGLPLFSRVLIRSGFSTEARSVLDLGFAMDLLALQNNGKDKPMQLTQLVLRGLAQGPAAVAGTGGDDSLDVYTILLWAFNRQANDEVILTNCTLELPPPEFHFLMQQTIDNAGSFVLDLAEDMRGTDDGTILFAETEIAGPDTLVVHLLSGNGLTGNNLTLISAPRAALIPGGYYWFEKSVVVPVLPAASSLTGSSLAAAVAVPIVVAAVLAVALWVLTARKCRHDRFEQQQQQKRLPDDVEQCIMSGSKYKEQLLPLSQASCSSGRQVDGDNTDTNGDRDCNTIGVKDSETPRLKDAVNVPGIGTGAAEVPAGGSKGIKQQQEHELGASEPAADNSAANEELSQQGDLADSQKVASNATLQTCVSSISKACLDGTSDSARSMSDWQAAQQTLASQQPLPLLVGQDSSGQTVYHSICTNSVDAADTGQIHGSVSNEHPSAVQKLSQGQLSQQPLRGEVQQRLQRRQQQQRQQLQAEGQQFQWQHEAATVATVSGAAAGNLPAKPWQRVSTAIGLLQQDITQRRLESGIVPLQRRNSITSTPSGAPATGAAAADKVAVEVANDDVNGQDKGRQQSISSGSSGNGMTDVTSSASPSSPGSAKQPELHLLDIIGKGTFASVFRAIWRGRYVAVKLVHLPADAMAEGANNPSAALQTRERMAVMEAVVSVTMSHPNIVQVYTFALRPLPAAVGPQGLPKHLQEWQEQQAAVSQQQRQQDAAVCGWELQLVMEYCEEGSLRQALNQRRLADPHDSNSLPALHIVLALAHDVACAMLHLHSENLIHGDLKASNVLLTKGAAAPAATLLPRHGSGAGSSGGRSNSMAPSVAVAAGVGVACALSPGDKVSVQPAPSGSPAVAVASGTTNNGSHAHSSAGRLSCAELLAAAQAAAGGRLVAKIADFGLSLSLNPGDTHVSHMHAGTLTHMAPELLLHGHASKPSDVYAFGILFWELATGRRAFQGVPVALLGHNVAHLRWRPGWVPGVAPPLKVLVEQCWAHQASHRPSFQQVLQRLEQLLQMSPEDMLAADSGSQQSSTSALGTSTRGSEITSASGAPGHSITGDWSMVAPQEQRQ